MALPGPSYSAEKLRALSSQVGGHPGVLTSEDNVVIIKPSLPREKAFYESLVHGATKELEVLREFVPQFYGTLRLEGKVKEGSDIEIGQIEPVASAKPEEKDEHAFQTVMTRAAGT